MMERVQEGKALSDRLIVSVREERSAHSVVRTASLKSGAGHATSFFEVSGDVLPPPLLAYDFAVLAAIFTAMREGRPMHVEGPVTETLLRNLEEFQEAWALWRSRYKPIRITADQVLPAASAALRTGVFAFSGGVDGTFALLRHLNGQAGLRSARPACAMLVHGFDLPLDQPQAFERARLAIAEMTSALGVPLAIVRTNWSKEICNLWPMEFSAGLAACLHQFQGLANVGVLGADEDYAHLELPWGSNPITNHFLSGGGFHIHTEGAGFTRTERVRLICEYPEIAPKLRVCWQGPATGGNCGRCEKCVRTKLNFMANKREPTCFDNKLTHTQILGLTARNRLQVAYLREIMQSARKNGVKASWLSALAVTVAKNRALLPMRELQGRIRARLRRRLSPSPPTQNRQPELQVRE